MLAIKKKKKKLEKTTTTKGKKLVSFLFFLVWGRWYQQPWIHMSPDLIQEYLHKDLLSGPFVWEPPEFSGQVEQKSE